MGSSLRSTITSGWMPMPRSVLTLCWVSLVFELAGGADLRQPGDVDVQHVAANVLAHLADRLQEGQRLDVADRAAHLHDHHAVGRQAAGRHAPVPSRATRAIRSLISLVMCGMTWTVPPR